MSKVDMQLFLASLRVVKIELEPLHDKVSKKVFDELDAMKRVIERDIPNEH